MENIILNAAGISKTYHAGSVDVEALKKSDVLFKRGKFAAIVGKSGSGQVYTFKDNRNYGQT